MPILQVNNLKKGFGGLNVLKGVSFTLEYADFCVSLCYTDGVYNYGATVLGKDGAFMREITLDDAKKIAANGCHYITEGSNMPCTREATDYLVSEGVTILPSKAANAGGVAVSTLEMSQNSVRQYRTFTDLDRQLKDIMINIYRSMNAAADDYGVSGNYISGANIAGFRRVAKAMRMEGYV